MDFEGLSVAGCLPNWNVIQKGRKLIICMNSTSLSNLSWEKSVFVVWNMSVLLLSFVSYSFHGTGTRPAMQLYQPGARNRKRMGSGNKTFDFPPISPEHGGEHCYKTVIGTGSEKSADEWKKRDQDRKKSTFRSKGHARIERTVEINLVFCLLSQCVSIVHEIPT